MHDDELDEILRRSASPMTAAATAVATDLAVRTRRVALTPSKQRRWFRRPAAVAGILAGTIALSAGATITAQQLGLPPFQTLPDGLQRADQPIPLDYERSDGIAMRCLVFLEFSDLTSTQLSRVDAAVTDEVWSAQRQRELTGRAADTPPPAEQSDVLTQALGPRLFEFAAAVVPGLADRGDTKGEPSFAGYGASCREVPR